MKKLCIDCNVNVSVERKRCVDCVKIYNRERVKKYYKKDKPRYGVINCDICGEEMIKKRPEQTNHGKCKIQHKTVEDYNKVRRSNKGNTIARQKILDLGFKLTTKMVVHHLDGTPDNNVLSNFWLINSKNHASLHRFLEKQWSLLKKLNSSNLENCWNNLRDQLTTTWLETTGVNVIKITDIGRSAAEPLNENNIYVFICEKGSETMYQIPETDKAVGKDIVQTQIDENHACESKLGM
jgi:hypothetical protein